MDTNDVEAPIESDEYRLWRYWIRLESMMVSSEPFCTIADENLNAFSDEYAKIIILSSVHFETCTKQLVKKWGGGPSDTENMGQIRSFIVKQREGFCSLPLEIFAAGRQVTPLSAWKEGKPAEFWLAYTSIKHSYHTSSKLATQQNAIEALAAGLVTLLYIFEKQPRYRWPHSSLLLYPRSAFLVDLDPLKLP